MADNGVTPLRPMSLALLFALGVAGLCCVLGQDFVGYHDVPACKYTECKDGETCNVVKFAQVAAVLVQLGLLPIAFGLACAYFIKARDVLDGKQVRDIDDILFSKELGVGGCCVSIGLLLSFAGWVVSATVWIPWDASGSFTTCRCRLDLLFSL